MSSLPNLSVYTSHGDLHHHKKTPQHEQRWSRSVSDYPLLMPSPSDLDALHSSSGSEYLNRGGRSDSVTTNPYEGFEVPPSDHIIHHGKRNRANRTSHYSPTPSLRRGKVAALLKEHGSPPGVRVTAGGRIVPENLSPLQSPRFEKPFGKNMQSYQTVPRVKPEQLGSSIDLLNGYVVNIGNGTMCQIVDGQLLHVGYQNGPLHLIMEPTNPMSSPQLISNGPLTNTGSFGTYVMPPSTSMPPTVAALTHWQDAAYNEQAPSLNELRLAEENYAVLETSLKELNRNEVLQRNTLTPTGHADITRRRVDLTLRLDQSRKTILKLKELHGISPTEPQGKRPTPTNTDTDGNNGLAVHNHSVPLAHVPYSNLYGCAPSTYAQPSTGYEQAPVYVDYGQVFPVHEVPHNPMPFHEHAPPAMYIQNENAPSSFVPQSAFNETRELRQHSGNEKNVQPASSWLVPPEGPPKGVLNSHTGRNMSMNLDGSGTQSRRSHAVEIKHPKESVARMKLDPTKPSYQPGQNLAGQHSLITNTMNHPNDALCLSSSSGLAAEIDKLVQSPARKIYATTTEKANGSGREQNSSEGIDESFQTGSSATTGDFFPTNTAAHSSKRYPLAQESEHSEVNLAAWMKKSEGDQMQHKRTTPVRASTKFIFNDSPDENIWSCIPHSSERPRTAIFVGASERIESNGSPGNRRAARTEEPNVAHGSRYSEDSEPRLKSSQSLPIRGIQKDLSDSIPAKSDAYWAGWKIGYKAGIIDFNEKTQDEDFRKGYRDGLLSHGSMSAGVGLVQSSDVISPFTSPEQPDFTPHCTTAHSSGPCVPANSIASTPLRRSANDAYDFTGVSKSLDTGIGNRQRHGSPKPPSSDSRMISDESWTRKRPTETETGSPLATRSMANVLRPYPPPPSRMLSGGGFDQQRYTVKVSSSVAPTKLHVSGSFPPPYDGSNEDEDNEDNKVADVLKSPVSSGKEKGKEKMSAPSSPVRRASSAVTNLMQFGGRCKKEKSPMIEEVPHDASSFVKSKREDDPSKMTTPEKNRWKARWRKRFDDLRREETREIDDYNRAHPPPQT